MRDELLLRHPWLSAADFAGPSGRGRKRAKPSGASGDAAAAGDTSDDGEEPVGPAIGPAGALDVVGLEEMDDNDGDDPALEVHDDHDARRELAEVRAEWSWEEQDEMNFYTRVLGGAWTKRELGVAADCVSGFARAWVQDWCTAFGWPSSARFGFARFGRADAHQRAPKIVHLYRYPRCLVVETSTLNAARLHGQPR
jgi:hypothetical protein